MSPAPLLALLLTVAPFEQQLGLWIGEERVGRVQLRFDGTRLRYRSEHWVRRGEALEIRADERTLEPGREKAAPATLQLLALPDDGARHCLPALDEVDRHLGEVCGTRTGQRATGELLAEPFEAEFEAGALASIRFTRQGSELRREPADSPLPVPADLFAGELPAGGLALLQRFDAAAVDLRGPHCRRVVAVGSQPGAPIPLHPVAGPFAAELKATGATDVASLATWLSEELTPVEGLQGESDAARVWAARRASCVGSAALFEALARAGGLEVRRVVGLLVEEGRMRPHAWSEVRTERGWRGVDATRGRLDLATTWVPLGRPETESLEIGRCLLDVRRLEGRVLTGRKDVHPQLPERPADRTHAPKDTPRAPATP